MHSHHSFPVAALGALLLACSPPRQTPVPLVGAARDVAALEGQWDGSPAVLTINFVRVAEGRVTGTLAPYADPETGVQLFTAFEGLLRGDVIEGTYATRAGRGVDSQTGVWKVTRRKP